MKRLILVVAIFLIVIALFRVVNGSPVLSLSDVLVKFDSFRFDISPFLEMRDLFASDESDSSTYSWFTAGLVFDPMQEVETVDPNGNVSIEIQQPDREGPTDLFEALAFMLDFLWIFLKILWVPFDVLFQVLDLGLWMLGFAA